MTTMSPPARKRTLLSTNAKWYISFPSQALKARNHTAPGTTRGTVATRPKPPH
jgi:hypothetical protein